jgi:hypothetical protein
MRRLAIWFVLVAVLGLMLGTGQAWAQATATATTAVGPTPIPIIPIDPLPPIGRVPEPGPLIGAGVVTLMGLGYAWLRRKRATA